MWGVMTVVFIPFLVLLLYLALFAGAALGLWESNYGR